MGQAISNSISDTNEIVTFFKQNFPKLTSCQIMQLPELQNLTIFSKESASETNILFASIFKNEINADIAVKMWLNWEDQDMKKGLWNSVDLQSQQSIENQYNRSYNNMGLFTEVHIFKYITEQIIMKNLSPNFIPMIAFAQCDIHDIILKLSQVKTQNSENLIQNLKNVLSVFPNIKLNIMITGTQTGKITTMGNFIKQIDLEEPDIAAILLQCLHALYVMEQFQINHNDMHLGNILVQTLDEPQCLSFQIGNNAFSFVTKYVPKFFDWDRGFAPVVNNPWFKDNLYKNLNIGDKFVPNRDYYQFVCDISDFPKWFAVLKKILPYGDYKFWSFGGAKDENQTFNLSRLELKENLRLYISDPKFYETFTYDDRNIYFNMPTEVAKAIFLQSEIEKLFKIARFEQSDTVFFSLDKKITKITSYSGWFCQPLYEPSEKLLTPLYDMFTDMKYLLPLTQFATFCSGMIPQPIVSVVKKYAPKSISKRFEPYKVKSFQTPAKQLSKRSKYVWAPSSPAG